MAYESEYQSHRGGPLTAETIAFLDRLRVENQWTFKQLGERLNISGPWAHKLLTGPGNITTSTYMPRIAEGIDRLKTDYAEGALRHESRVETSRTMREHSYHLREDSKITFRLPADLTEREAERLSLFIRSLAE